MHEQVESLEDMSERSRAGSRCFERILMCKPYSIWFQSPGREWHAKLKYGTLGQEVWATILALFFFCCFLFLFAAFLPFPAFCCTLVDVMAHECELLSSCQAENVWCVEVTAVCSRVRCPPCMHLMETDHPEDT